VLLDVLRDVGIAFLVAVVTALSIELFVNARARREITHDVFQATFRQFLPGPIYLQLRDSVLGSPVIRRDWNIDLRVLDPAAHPEIYESMRKLGEMHCYVVECLVSYAIENLRSASTPFLVSGGIDLDTSFPSIGIPRFSSILLGADDVKKDRGRFISDADATAMLSGEKPSLNLTGGLSIMQDEGELIFREMRVLPPRVEISGDPDDHAQLTVRYGLLRPLRVPGMIVLASATPADGFSARVSTVAGVEFVVTALHSDTRMKRAGPNGWELKEGILPWQGFIFRASSPASRAAAQP
jgi:hypothetical protein